MRRKFLKYITVCFCVLVMFAPTIQAACVYPIEIFTNNGDYFNSLEINLYVEVSQLLPEQIDFTFHNDSQIDSCIAEIYFDTDDVLASALITNGPGTFYVQAAKPSNLPAAMLLNPPFVTADVLSFDCDAPPPHYGINPNEWLKVTFELAGVTYGEIIDGFESNQLRIGIHIIALPDGSSESAVTVPEPTTICLLGLASLAIFQKRKK